MLGLGGTLGARSAELKIPVSAFAVGLGDHRIVTALCPRGKEPMRHLMNVMASRRIHLGLLIRREYKLEAVAATCELVSNQRDGALKLVSEVFPWQSVCSLARESPQM